MTDPIADTRRWLERAVIGLNLCPFAKAVMAKDQVRFVLSDATDPAQLLETLGEELVHLRNSDPALASSSGDFGTSFSPSDRAETNASTSSAVF